MVPQSEIVQKLAHCTGCGHVWEVAGPRSAFEPSSPPEGARVARFGADEVVVDLPWRQDNRLYHALWLFVLVPFFAGATVSSMLMGGLALIAWTVLHLNVTSVRVTREGVEVLNTFPVPGNLDVQLDREALKGLSVQRQMESQGRYNRRLVRFFGLGASGGTLLRSWDTEEKVAFVRDAIAHVHGEDVLQPDHTLPLEPPPFGVIVAPIQGGGRLEMPWSAHGGAGIHAVGLVGMMMLSGGGMFAAPFAAPLIAMWVYLMRNTTTITLRRDGIRIANGPIPTPWEPDIHLRPTQLAALHIVERSMRLRHSTMTWYDLMQGGQTVLRGWNDPGKLEYVIESAKAIAESEPAVERTAEARPRVQPARTAQT